MYLWKYWRETCWAFGVSMVCVLALFVFVLRTNVYVQKLHVQVSSSNSSSVAARSALRPPRDAETGGSLADMPTMAAVSLYGQIMPLALLAWVLGSAGIGRDLGENAGSFLLTRPRSRRSILWREWGYGMAGLTIVTALANLAFWLFEFRFLLSMGNPLHGSVLFPGSSAPVSLALLAGLAGLGGWLIAALVFSVTYFSTILLRHMRGIMLGAGVFVVYLIAGALLHHRWPVIHFPSLILPAFRFSDHLVTGINHGVGLQIAFRVLVVLLFPLAAQFLLERAEV